MLRPALEGESAPLALLDDPQQGTGQSLFARLVSVLATGSQSAATAGGRDEAEWRKAITSHLLAGITYVLIDNVSRPLRSDALSAVLTSPVWQDRILGASRTVTFPVHPTWVATGNNIKFRVTLIRR